MCPDTDRHFSLIGLVLIYCVSLRAVPAIASAIETVAMLELGINRETAEGRLKTQRHETGDWRLETAGSRRRFKMHLNVSR